VCAVSTCVSEGWSVCAYLYDLSVCLAFFLTCVHACVFVCLSVYLSLSVCLSLSVSLSVCPSVYFCRARPSVCACVCRMNPSLSLSQPDAYACSLHPIPVYI